MGFSKTIVDHIQRGEPVFSEVLDRVDQQIETNIDDLIDYVENEIADIDGNSSEVFSVKGSRLRGKPTIALGDSGDVPSTIPNMTNNDDGVNEGSSVETTTDWEGLSFDGSNYIRVEADHDDRFTIEIIGRADSFSSSNYPGLFQAQDGDTTPSNTGNDKSVAGWVQSSDGDVYGRIIQSDGTEQDLPTDGTATINTGDIHRFTFIADGSTYQLYIDGDFKKEVSYDGTVQSFDRFFIGIQEDKGWEGFLSDFRYWRGAVLSNTQINARKELRLIGTEPGLNTYIAMAKRNSPAVPLGIADALFDTNNDLQNHIEDTNPHDVTKDQVNLGNVENTQQLPEEDFENHTTGQTSHSLESAAFFDVGTQPNEIPTNELLYEQTSEHELSSAFHNSSYYYTITDQIFYGQWDSFLEQTIDDVNMDGVYDMEVHNNGVIFSIIQKTGFTGSSLVMKQPPVIDGYNFTTLINDSTSWDNSGLLLLDMSVDHSTYQIFTLGRKSTNEFSLFDLSLDSGFNLTTERSITYNFNDLPGISTAPNTKFWGIHHNDDAIYIHIGRTISKIDRSIITTLESSNALDGDITGMDINKDNTLITAVTAKGILYVIDPTDLSIIWTVDFRVNRSSDYEWCDTVLLQDFSVVSVGYRTSSSGDRLTIRRFDEFGNVIQNWFIDDLVNDISDNRITGLLPAFIEADQFDNLFIYDTGKEVIHIVDKDFQYLSFNSSKISIDDPHTSSMNRQNLPQIVLLPGRKAEGHLVNSF